MGRGAIRCIDLEALLQENISFLRKMLCHFRRLFTSSNSKLECCLQGKKECQNNELKYVSQSKLGLNCIETHLLFEIRMFPRVGFVSQEPLEVF
jgi:hypothetical protein